MAASAIAHDPADDSDFAPTAPLTPPGAFRFDSMLPQSDIASLSSVSDASALREPSPKKNKYRGRSTGATNKEPGKRSVKKSAAARRRTHTNLSHCSEQQGARGKKSLMVQCPRCQYVFSKKNKDDEDAELLGDAARKVLMDATDDAAGGDVYWLESYAIARDILQKFRNGDRFEGIRVVAADARDQTSLDSRASKWTDLLSTSVKVGVPPSHAMPASVAELVGKDLPVITAMRAMQLHEVVQKDTVKLKDRSRESDAVCGTLLGKFRSVDLKSWVKDFETFFGRSPFQGSVLDRLLDFAIFQHSFDVPVDRNSEITLEMKQFLGSPPGFKNERVARS